MKNSVKNKKVDPFIGGATGDLKHDARYQYFPQAAGACRRGDRMRYIELAFTTTQLENKRLRIVIQNAGFKIID
jgi:hypothetical protein